MRKESLLAQKWIDFLNEIEELRNKLRCSQSPAWFRGQCNEVWPLDPTLFRFGNAEDPEDLGIVRTFEAEIQDLKAKWKQSLQSKTELRVKLQLFKNDELLRKELQQRYEHSYNNARLLKANIANVRRDLRKFTAPVNGERELFDEFIFRAGRTVGTNSWETLAEMRHYGVPTRLLDWTDRLDIALYFSLEEFRNNIPYTHDYERTHEIASKLPRPCIWVLNPYLLSKRATGRTAIWNLALDPTHDYYGLMLRGRKWPYDEPIPTYPPAPMERVRAQRGYFTVFGNSKASMNFQMKDGITCLAKIVLSVEAAIFCMDYLNRIQGLTKFEVYRDLDSLGHELTTRLRRIHDKK